MLQGLLKGKPKVDFLVDIVAIEAQSAIKNSLSSIFNTRCPNKFWIEIQRKSQILEIRILTVLFVKLKGHKQTFANFSYFDFFAT